MRRRQPRQEAYIKLHQGKDSGMNLEDEERAFKAKAAAVVRRKKRTDRFHGDTPYYRFTRPEPAVGGPSGEPRPMTHE